MTIPQPNHPSNCRHTTSPMSPRRLITGAALLLALLFGTAAFAAPANAEPAAAQTSMRVVPTGQTWGGGGGIDYYGFCYYNNRKPATFQTHYVGAELQGKPGAKGSGVLCKAKAWKVGGAFAYPATFNNFFSWDQVCKISGWRGGVTAVSSNGVPTCKS